MLLTSTSLKIPLMKLAEGTRETEHRSAMHSARKVAKVTPLLKGGLPSGPLKFSPNFCPCYCFKDS